MASRAVRHAQLVGREADYVPYLPYLRHASEDVIVLENGCCKALTTYENDGVLFSRPLEVLHFLMTGDELRIPIIDGPIGQALYSSRIIFGSETIEFRLPHRTQYGVMFGIRDYVAQTRTGQFNALLKLNMGFVLTQSFTSFVKSSAMDKLHRRRRQLASSDDVTLSQADDLVASMDELNFNRFVMGDHHLSLMVTDHDPKRLIDRVGNMLFLKPREKGRPTNLIVLTSYLGTTRSYHFELGINSGPMVYEVRFRYPAEEARAAAELALLAHARQVEAVETKVVNSALDHAVIEGKRNLDYWLQGASELQPSEISDNGEFTVLRYPGHADIPSIFAVNGDGSESIVPYDVREEYVVLHGVWHELHLRKGGLVLCITNRGPLRNDRDSRTGTASPLIERNVLGSKP